MEGSLVAAGLMTVLPGPDGAPMRVPVDGVAIDRIGACGPDLRYHVNVRIASGVVFDESELLTFQPLPVTPYRVWFEA